MKTTLKKYTSVINMARLLHEKYFSIGKRAILRKKTYSIGQIYIRFKNFAGWFNLIERG
jgi:hypothetical protein